MSGHREPFQGLDRGPLLLPALCPSLQGSSPSATVTFLSHFRFFKATSAEAEEDLETILPVILGTFLKH